MYTTDQNNTEMLHLAQLILPPRIIIIIIICFQVDPNDVWLRGDLDNKAYFPNESGAFDLSDTYDGAVLVVEGPEPVIPRTTTVSSTAQSNVSGASSAYHSNPPPFKSVIPRSKAGSTTSVKILKAEMSTSRTGKVDFEQSAQMHIDVTETTANVCHILREVHQKWGEGYVLVTLNGLQLEDCEGTRGKFFVQSDDTYIRGQFV